MGEADRREACHKLEKEASVGTEKRVSLGVVVCAIIMGILGIYGLGYGMVMINWAALSPEFYVLGLITLAQGVLSLAATYGLMKLMRWGRIVTICVNLLRTLFLLIFTRQVYSGAALAVEITISLMIVAYMLLPKVRSTFSP